MVSRYTPTLMIHSFIFMIKLRRNVISYSIVNSENSFQALCDQTTPQYLKELCIPVTESTSCYHLHCAIRGDLQVLACHTSSFGPCGFAACTAKLWNNPLSSLRDPTLTLTLFCSRLKTYLFGTAYKRTLMTA